MSHHDADVAVIGAGPYGISIAAHLAATGLDFRIFGQPMHRWRCQMPCGMFLKSEGCSSSLSDPLRRHTLAHFCQINHQPYGDWGKPVSLQLFIDYALDFQRKLALSIEDVTVTAIRRDRDRFRLESADGWSLHARKVIVATGLDRQENSPAPLVENINDLPRALWSHSSAHRDLSRFKGKEVVVIGGGQSAIETAVLLADNGASVRLLVRRPDLSWNSPPSRSRSAYRRFRHPSSGLGIGLELWAYCRAAVLFRHLPAAVRERKLATVLGPSGAWWLRERLNERVDLLVSHHLRSARAHSGRVVLRFDNGAKGLELTADHVIAATGYRFALDRLPFLDPGLTSAIRAVNGMPELSRSFESSIPGLYFTGLASGLSFGPSMRFIEGARFTATRLVHHLAGGRRAPIFAPASQCNA
jgi:thioredoxin reductase